ncbi:MAG: hypothetical protein ABI557_11935 [Aureliella sp.]
MRTIPENLLYRLSILLLAGAVGPGAVDLRADDWMTWASTYTHSPENGQRVDQYALGEQPNAPFREDFSRSGYRNYRSTLQAGQSADNLHVVEQWGQPVIPYEQWRFPFRPYAVPYDAWGPQAPYGITNGSFQANIGGNPGGYGSTGAGPMPNAGYGNGSYGNGNNGNGNNGIPAPNQWRGGQYNSNGPNASRGFPLTPTYNREPWYDGNYPTAPPLNAQ